MRISDCSSDVCSSDLSLDAFLIAAIQEVEELKGIELDAAQLEAALAKIWRRTYAHAASHGEAHMATIWLARGRAIKAQYPDADQRRRFYKTKTGRASCRERVVQEG